MVRTLLPGATLDPLTVRPVELPVEGPTLEDDPLVVALVDFPPPPPPHPVPLLLPPPEPVAPVVPDWLVGRPSAASDWLAASLAVERTAGLTRVNHRRTASARRATSPAIRHMSHLGR